MMCCTKSTYSLHICWHSTAACMVLLLLTLLMLFFPSITQNCVSSVPSCGECVCMVDGVYGMCSKWVSCMHELYCNILIPSVKYILAMNETVRVISTVLSTFATNPDP